MQKNTINIAVVSDFHYASVPNAVLPHRKGEWTPVLLSRMIRKLNEEVKPDLIIAAGDLINFPDAEDSVRLTLQIAEILKFAMAPVLVIRGNHDIPAEQFEKIFPFRRITDVGFVRIVAFDDPETPGHNAFRTGQDALIMQEAAKGWNGALISLQHTPLLPDGRCKYSYSNAEQMLDIMRKCGYSGTISAHYHAGIDIDPGESDSLRFHVQSALCEEPYVCSLIEIGQDKVMRCSEKITVEVISKCWKNGWICETAVLQSE